MIIKKIIPYLLYFIIFMQLANFVNAASFDYNSSNITQKDDIFYFCNDFLIAYNNSNSSVSINESDSNISNIIYNETNLTDLVALTNSSNSTNLTNVTNSTDSINLSNSSNLTNSINLTNYSYLENNSMYDYDDRIIYTIYLEDEILINDTQNFTFIISNYFDESKLIDLETYYYRYSVKYSDILNDQILVEARSNLTYVFNLTLNDYREGLKLKIKLKKSEIVTWKDFKFDLIYSNPVNQSTTNLNIANTINQETTNGLDLNNVETSLTEKIDYDMNIQNISSLILNLNNESLKRQLNENNYIFLNNNSLENILKFELDDFLNSIIDEIDYIDLETNNIFVKDGLNFSINNSSLSIDLNNSFKSYKNHSLLSGIEFIEKSVNTKKVFTYKFILIIIFCLLLLILISNFIRF